MPVPYLLLQLAQLCDQMLRHARDKAPLQVAAQESGAGLERKDFTFPCSRQDGTSTNLLVARVQRSLHRVSFAAAGLSVRHHCGVEAIQCVLHHGYADDCAVRRQLQIQVHSLRTTGTASRGVSMGSRVLPSKTSAWLPFCPITASKA